MHHIWVKTWGSVNVHSADLEANAITAEQFEDDVLADYLSRAQPATIIRATTDADVG